MRIAVLASHQGTNLQAILDAVRSGQLDATVGIVISNNSRSGAMKRAKTAGIATLHLSSVTHPDEQELDDAMLDAIMESKCDWIVTAGYMKKLGPNTLSRFNGRTINIHPSLLPRHGGHGMFGLAVHQSVLNAGDTETGATVHFLDQQYDTGAMIRQVKLPVQPGETAQSLADRLRPLEHQILIETLAQFGRAEG